jgi:hypothetical protein
MRSHLQKDAGSWGNQRVVRAPGQEGWTQLPPLAQLKAVALAHCSKSSLQSLLHRLPNQILQIRGPDRHQPVGFSLSPMRVHTTSSTAARVEQLQCRCTLQHLSITIQHLSVTSRD